MATIYRDSDGNKYRATVASGERAAAVRASEHGCIIDREKGKLYIAYGTEYRAAAAGLTWDEYATTISEAEGTIDDARIRVWICHECDSGCVAVKTGGLSGQPTNGLDGQEAGCNASKWHVADLCRKYSNVDIEVKARKGM